MTQEPWDVVAPHRTVEDVHAEHRLGEPWSQALYEHQQVVFDLARPKLVVLTASGACVALLGVLLMVGDPVGVSWGLATTILGAVLLARFARLLRASRAAVRVDTFGLRVRPGNERHPWRDILGATSRRERGDHFVSVRLSESARAGRFSHRSPTYRRVRRVLPGPAGDAVLVLPHPLAADPQRLASWLAKEAIYRNPELRRALETDLAQEVTSPLTPR